MSKEIKLLLGDSLIKLKELENNSVDSIVTDPPYELGFMGKSWDSTGIANNVELWKECLRVLKPGGHLLAFSGTRTYHRMASAIEDAGFEVRDMIEWVYGSGFPKSLNIGKAVDKLQGNEREIVGQSRNGSNSLMGGLSNTETKTIQDITKGTSEWEGWGTALKPAHEPICMARKPLAEKTVAENVLKYGTGGINIDESRVGTEIITQRLATVEGGKAIGGKGVGIKQKATGETTTTIGRFPANLIHDNSEEVRECFPETKKGSKSGYNWEESEQGNVPITKNIKSGIHFGDSGDASRFFKSIIYQAKASKSERNKGCDGLIDKKAPKLKSISNFCIKCGKREDYKCNCNVGFEYKEQPNYQNITKNNHPTVKPIALMEYLIKMVTPKGGIVLDPFMGSGSTGVAAKQNDYGFIGIDMTPEYIEIAKARIDSVGLL